MIDKNMKWVSECLAAGFEYIGRGYRKGYSIVKCMTCGTVDEFRQDNIRAGNARCDVCHKTKMIDESLERGFEWIRKVDGNNSLCRCLNCGHEDTYQQSAMRRGEVKCSQCHKAKMMNECLEYGFEWIRKVDGYNSLCRCLKCGHEDVFDQSAMRVGSVKCSHCHKAKMMNECLEHGFEWISKVDKNNSLCRCFKCGHEDTYQQSAMRVGKVSCSSCSPGHWNEPCFFYVVRISIGYYSLIKIGISNNPALRYKQYGLPSDAFIEQLQTIPFDTKLDAVKYESKMKQLLEPYRIDLGVAKEVLTYSGFTECYDERSLDILI